MLNETVPNFSLPSTGDKDFQLDRERGKTLVLYFYPKDNTPGCTTEASQFRDLYTKFEASGCAIYGISRDSIQSHQRFKTKLMLPFDLLADCDETVASIFGVIKMKQMYGKSVRGIERSTFLLDAQGVLRHEWRGVKADGHAAEVLAAVPSLTR